MPQGELAVGVGCLLGEDLDGGEERRESGLAELLALFEVIALGDEDEAVGCVRGAEGRRLRLAGGRRRPRRCCRRSA